LELEPACHVASDLFSGAEGSGVIDLFGGADRFGQQLGLATAVHGDEPPRGFLYAVAHSKQAVILEDGGFTLAEGFRDALAF
jgi:hypothetical protein